MLPGDMINQIINLLGCSVIRRSGSDFDGFGRVSVVDKLINLFGIGINLLAIFASYFDNFLALNDVFR